MLHIQGAFYQETVLKLEWSVSIKRICLQSKYNHSENIAEKTNYIFIILSHLSNKKNARNLFLEAFCSKFLKFAWKHL